VNTNRRNPGAVVRYIVCRLRDPQPGDAGRGRRRPPWRRSPSSLSPTEAETPTGPPPTPATPAALAAARRAEAGK
jgi:shikimate kinase